MQIDKWPSTPVHLITAWAMTVITWGAMLYKALFAGVPHMELVYALCALVAAYGGFGVVQMIGKRATETKPAVTE